MFVQVLILFAPVQELSAVMHQLLHAIVDTTLQMSAQLNCANQLSDKSDVLEAFFLTLAQILKRNPQFVFSGSLDCNSLFQCGKKLT